MTEGVRLTEQQRWLLNRLAKLGNGSFGGYNPQSFGGAQEAARARRLAGRGLVHLNPLGHGHIRYSITPAGRAALLKREG